jgi:hypothetical protein
MQPSKSLVSDCICLMVSGLLLLESGRFLSGKEVNLPWQVIGRFGCK